MLNVKCVIGYASTDALSHSIEAPPPPPPKAGKSVVYRVCGYRLEFGRLFDQ